MAFDTSLADRVRKMLQCRHVAYEEKKMMGGICFMVNDKMCVVAHDDRLMARIDPEKYAAALRRKGAGKVIMRGKELKGYVHVQPPGTQNDKDLDYWIHLCLEFNPKAKASRNKRKSN